MILGLAQFQLSVIAGSRVRVHPCHRVLSIPLAGLSALQELAQPDFGARSGSRFHSLPSWVGFELLDLKVNLLLKSIPGVIYFFSSPNNPKPEL